ncbi:hypothetical protein A1OE_375 [Candidatus Endolissoclinum faulkneri L2]|uniref:Uncharacterized protein n=1 Tax=Candidatus Endolissoclinum faulkneri L2 TaxID=1193729 RepID=K7YG38_9PROT|nr:hypothetical protein A1OE_375 [Candidatus Endolissoclinum faulkneri L2]
MFYFFNKIFYAGFYPTSTNFIYRRGICWYPRIKFYLNKYFLRF